MKNAYLLMTDLHLDLVKANRLNYFGEILDAMTNILDIASKYKADGYNVHLMMLGDVFDGSLPNASDAMQASEVMQFFCSKFDSVYSVVGNHEITYATDNPFWFMVTEIHDESLSRIRRFIQPRGLNNKIAIPDTVEDGNVIFYFNHFGVEPKVPKAGVISIGLFHQNVGSNDICKMWGTFDDVEEAAYVQAYCYCFFGHMHLAKGKFFLNESHTCQAEWLGSIGRTKVDEVIDDSLKVNIPCVLVEDGEFKNIDDNYIELQSASQCIDYTKLQAVSMSKRVIEEQRKNITSTYKGGTLLETLKGSFANTSYAFLLDLLGQSWNEVVFTYKQSLSDPLKMTDPTDENEESDETAETQAEEARTAFIENSTSTEVI